MPLVPSLAGQPKFIENQLVLIREGLRDIPAKGMLDGLKDAELLVLAKYFSAQTRQWGGHLL
jgi:cytochrome c553